LSEEGLIVPQVNSQIIDVSSCQEATIGAESQRDARLWQQEMIDTPATPIKVVN